MIVEQPKIECPDKPIPDVECIMAERRVIESRREMADVIRFIITEDDRKVPREFDAGDRKLIEAPRFLLAWAENLEAEARLSEIKLHNLLWQAGQIQGKLVQKATLIPSSGGGRRM